MNRYVLLLIIFVANLTFSFAQTPEEKIQDMGITLPEISQPLANYVKWRQVGNMLYLSGSVSSAEGKLGVDLTADEGYKAARETGVQILATLKVACGDLSRIKQFVKVNGMVNSAPSFYDQSKVMNGFSDLMAEVFGEAGKHARVAVGQSSLPFNRAVEIDVIVELRE